MFLDSNNVDDKFIHICTILLVIILIIISNEDWIKAQFRKEMEIEKR